jgi:hypothetical protein
VSANSAEFVQKLLDSPDYARFARHAFERLVGEFEEPAGIEACRQPFEAQRRYMPVSVTSGATEQIDLTGHALGKDSAQFTSKDQIVPCCRIQRRIKIKSFVSHETTIAPSG